MRKGMLVLLLVMFSLSFVVAEETIFGTFERGEDINLMQTCSDCSYNNITSILLPNGSIVVSNMLMSKDDTSYNYTLGSGNTTALGRYLVNGVGDLGGVKTVWNYDFLVTPSGTAITTGNSIIVFLAILLFFILGGILLTFSFKENMKLPIKWSLMLGSALFFLTATTLISSVLPDALINDSVVVFFDTWNAISFYLFWFIFVIIALIWFLTFFATILLRKKIARLEKFG